MSRIGKQVIPVPTGVSVDIKGSAVSVKGPKGELMQRFDPDMTVSLADGQLTVERPSDLRHHRARHGLTRALLANMVHGVSEGYEIRLRIIGTGYRAEQQGEYLKLNLGYSHDILVEMPGEVTFELDDRGGMITLRSPNKELIGQVAADIRKLRPPEPYKGKGIRYDDERVRMKAGKAGKK